jgi:hypothetical protein
MFILFTPPPHPDRSARLEDSARMIGTVNLYVTVHALFTQHALVSTFRGNARAAVDPTGMEESEMALLAQVRLA